MSLWQKIEFPILQIMKNCSVVILCAGNSIRMGYPKAFLPYQQNQNFLSRLIDVYTIAKCEKFIIVVNKHIMDQPWRSLLYSLEQNFQLILNKRPEFGRVYSIMKGLMNCSPDDHVFIQDVDMPFITEEVLSVLFAAKVTNGYVVPEFQGKNGHPVLLGPGVTEELTSNNYKEKTFKEILNKFHREIITVSSNSIHLNINTKKDFEKTLMERT